MNKEQLMTDDDLVETIPIRYRYDREPLPRAKPEEQLTGCVRLEDMFGLLADAIDDEFLEIVLASRRGGLSKESRS
jgi:hypothetical protein